MISKEIMNRLLDRFEAAIVSEGIEYMCVNNRDEFQKSLFEREMKFDGLVIVRSKEGCEIFYVDTSELLFKK